MSETCSDHSRCIDNIDKLEKRAEAHGEELGEHMRLLTRLVVVEEKSQEFDKSWKDDAKRRIDSHDDRLYTLETAPARKWDKLAFLVIGTIVTVLGSLVLRIITFS